MSKEEDPLGSGSLGKETSLPSLDEAGLDIYTGEEGYLMQTVKQEQRGTGGPENTASCKG